MTQTPDKRFILYIDLENDAFQPTPNAEIASILRELAARIFNSEAHDLHFYKTIFDSNGNDVGRYAIKDKIQACIVDKR